MIENHSGGDAQSFFDFFQTQGMEYEWAARGTKILLKCPGFEDSFDTIVFDYGSFCAAVVELNNLEEGIDGKFIPEEKMLYVRW